MPWKNSRYPVNNYKTNIPHEVMCEHCGRDQYSHASNKRVSGKVGVFNLCLEEKLPLARAEVRESIKALAQKNSRYPLIQTKKKLKEILDLINGIEMKEQHLKREQEIRRRV